MSPGDPTGARAAQRTSKDGRLAEPSIDARRASRFLAERAYKFLSEHAADVAIIVDSAARVKYVSPWIQRPFGYDPKALIGENGLGVVHPDDLPSAVIALQEGLLRPGPHPLIELRVRRADGSWAHVEAASQNCLDDPEIGGFVVLSRDISRFRESETRRSRDQTDLERLSAAVNMTADSVVISDLNGVIQFANQATARMWGAQDPSELIGRNSFDLIAPDELNLAMEGMEEALLTGSTANRTYHVITKEGGKLPVEMTAALVRDPAGHPTGFVGISRDVSEKKRREEERIRWSRLESIGVLAGGIAHDFNNLLTAILGNISFARQDAHGNDRYGKALMDAEKACTHAKALSKQLLTFARGGAPLKRPTALGGLVENSVRLAGSGSRVKIRVSIEPGIKAMEVDPDQIGQAIQNLVLNALQATRDGRTVEVRAENAPERPAASQFPTGTSYVRVSIRDRGTGIAPEHRDRIFDPYFTTKPGGSGLGLATAHSIVRKHGGFIEVDSQLGSGSTFDVYIPATPDRPATQSIEKPSRPFLDAPRTGHPGSPAPPTTLPPEPLQGRGRILLMDDDPDILAVLGRALTKLGYAAEPSRDGAQALETYERAMDRGETFDAVIVDLTVPGGMGGAEMMSRLLQMDPTACVIVSSGYSADPVLARYSEYGFKGMLPKPYRMEDVSRTLREILTTIAPKTTNRSGRGDC